MTTHGFLMAENTVNLRSMPPPCLHICLRNNPLLPILLNTSLNLEWLSVSDTNTLGQLAMEEVSSLGLFIFASQLSNFLFLRFRIILIGFLLHFFFFIIVCPPVLDTDFPEVLNMVEVITLVLLIIQAHHNTCISLWNVVL